MAAWLRCFLFGAGLVAAACDGGPTESAPARDASSSTSDPLYATVEDILSRSCAYVRCHSGAIVGGALELTRGTDFWPALVGVTACEYEGMKRVEPGDPERSWIMVKLTAPFRDRDDPYPFYIHFTPPPDWDPSVRGCRHQTEDGTPLFGQRMPLTAPNSLPEHELDAIRAWISAGAPR